MTYNQTNMELALSGNNRLKALGLDILRNIFEYDDTYLKIHKQEVVTNVWISAWKHWRNNSPECDDLYVATMIDWLFDLWGFNYTCPEPMKFFQKKFLPSDIYIWKEWIEPGEIKRVGVYFMGECNIDSDNNPMYNYVLHYNYFVIRTNTYDDMAIERRMEQYTDNIHNYVILLDDGTHGSLEMFS